MLVAVDRSDFLKAVLAIEVNWMVMELAPSLGVPDWLHLSPDELAELSGQVIALFDRWATRVVPEDGVQRDPVFVFTYGVPAQP
jgi:hypothetical protein